jgi:hypothetical protein
MKFLFFLCVALLFDKIAGGDASSACGNVLQQGVYNVFSSSKSTSTYAQFQSSMCSMDSSMTHEEYKNSGKNAQSRSSYDALNVDASFLDIFSAGGGHESENKEMTASQFEEFKKAVASYQSQYCGSKSENSGSSDLFNSYMRTISPEVFSAYQSCISLYSTGIQFSSQYGWGADSSFINIEFASDTYGARAEINGIVIVPDNSASCIFFGDKGPTNKFSASLVTDKTYTVACKSHHNATVDVMTIAISTTQGIYMTYLYNQPPAPLLSQLQAQVTQLQSKVTLLQTPMKQTIFSSGSGVFAISANPSPVYLKVRMVGGGAGGDGTVTGTNSGLNSGTNGGNSVFGDNILIAVGGRCPGGGGGSVALSSTVTGFVVTGGGGGGSVNVLWGNGSPGGNSAFGGGGVDGGGAPVGNGSTGGGGAGAGVGACSSAEWTGHGGGAGGYVEATISSPKSSYQYAVGTGGAGGAGGGCGGTGSPGGNGVIIVEEYFS